jgi:hypothetical protein
MTWRADIIDGPIPAYQFLGLDEDGNPQFGAQTSAYNLNIAPGIYTETLEQFRIEPTQPKRVFAGEPDDTVFLTFESEAEARAALAAYWVDA